MYLPKSLTATRQYEKDCDAKADAADEIISPINQNTAENALSLEGIVDMPRSRLSEDIQDQSIADPEKQLTISESQRKVAGDELKHKRGDQLFAANWTTYATRLKKQRNEELGKSNQELSRITPNNEQKVRTSISSRSFKNQPTAQMPLSAAAPPEISDLESQTQAPNPAGQVPNSFSQAVNSYVNPHQSFPNAAAQTSAYSSQTIGSYENRYQAPLYPAVQAPYPYSRVGSPHVTPSPIQASQGNWTGYHTNGPPFFPSGNLMLLASGPNAFPLQTTPYPVEKIDPLISGQPSDGQKSTNVSPALLEILGQAVSKWESRKRHQPWFQGSPSQRCINNRVMRIPTKDANLEHKDKWPRTACPRCVLKIGVYEESMCTYSRENVAGCLAPGESVAGDYAV